MLRGDGQRSAGGALETVSLFKESVGLQDPCQTWKSSGASVNTLLRCEPNCPFLLHNNIQVVHF